MSEPQKEPTKHNHKKHLVLLIALSIIIASGVVVILYFNDWNGNKGVTEFVKGDVVPEPQKEPIKSEKFDITNFGKCVRLLIDYVKNTPYMGEKLDTPTEIKLNDILSQYNELNCPLVEDQLSQTPSYKHRNDP